MITFLRGNRIKEELKNKISQVQYVEQIFRWQLFQKKKPQLSSGSLAEP